MSGNSTRLAAVAVLVGVVVVVIAVVAHLPYEIEHSHTWLYSSSYRVLDVLFKSTLAKISNLYTKQHNTNSIRIEQIFN